MNRAHSSGKHGPAWMPNAPDGMRAGEIDRALEPACDCNSPAGERCAAGCPVGDPDVEPVELGE